MLIGFGTLGSTDRGGGCAKPTSRWEWEDMNETDGDSRHALDARLSPGDCDSAFGGDTRWGEDHRSHSQDDRTTGIEGIQGEEPRRSGHGLHPIGRDRKSTRLNSSHVK